MSAASVSESSPLPPPPLRPTITSDALEERHQLASRVLTDALLLGVVGDALLRAGTMGANMTLWTIGMVAALLTLARRRHDSVPADARFLAIPALALSLMYVWRDEESLAAYNTLALIGTFALLATAVARGPRATLLASRVRDVVEHVADVGIRTAFGMLPLVLSDISLRQVAQTRTTARLTIALRALLIAVPLLLIFGGLFASADPVFARLLGDIFQIDAGKIASHLFLGGVIAWIAGGFLRASVLSNGTAVWSHRLPDGALGLTEVSVALGSLVLLFAAFVGVQVRYFFGGDTLVQSTAGLGYADYARRGFFELVMVSTLVLPVLLAANALLRRDTARADAVYRVLASTLLGLLGVIMYSALARMRLYQSVYGMTVDRLYATVFMGWLAVVFVWFAVTVLRGRGQRFVAGVLVSGWATLLALNVAGPATIVARANIARAAAGKEMDVLYIQSLGADAAPTLVSHLMSQPLTPPAGWVSPAAPQYPRSGTVSDRGDYTARCSAARQLLSNWAPNVGRDWRGWTLGKAQARRAVAANEPALRTLANWSSAANSLACPEPPAQVRP
ncbi:MAG TPA: DUF4173 domain-containing protein [Gemmatimonadaceae bacterium]|nr:DUF4173 domain-containing protein [Gemmatimonadaceae bacterium]